VTGPRHAARVRLIPGLDGVKPDRRHRTRRRAERHAIHVRAPGQRHVIYKHDPELPDYPAIVKFTIGPGGVATALTNSAFDATGQGTLTRV
jgi:hypothetical protein